MRDRFQRGGAVGQPRFSMPTTSGGDDFRHDGTQFALRLFAHRSRCATHRPVGPAEGLRRHGAGRFFGRRRQAVLDNDQRVAGGIRREAFRQGCGGDAPLSRRRCCNRSAVPAAAGRARSRKNSRISPASRLRLLNTGEVPAARKTCPAADVEHTRRTPRGGRRIRAELRVACPHP